jgi:hypothetical protein
MSVHLRGLNSWKRPYRYTEIRATWQQWDDGPRQPALQYQVQPRRWHPRYWWLRVRGRDWHELL